MKGLVRLGIELRFFLGDGDAGPCVIITFLVSSIDFGLPVITGLELLLFVHLLVEHNLLETLILKLARHKVAGPGALDGGLKVRLQRANAPHGGGIIEVGIDFHKAFGFKALRKGLVCIRPT